MDSMLLFAAFGGLAVSGLGLLELQGVPAEQRPDFKDPLYWLPFVAWPVVGVVLTIAYTSSGTSMNPILAINVGASAPLILKGMVNAAAISQGPIETPPGA